MSYLLGLRRLRSGGLHRKEDKCGGKTSNDNGNNESNVRKNTTDGGKEGKVVEKDRERGGAKNWKKLPGERPRQSIKNQNNDERSRENPRQEASVPTPICGK